MENKPFYQLPPKGYKLVWEDDFKQPKLDLKKWGYRYLGRRREGFNSKEAIQIDTKTNELVIKSFLRNDTAYTGMISTMNLFETTHGYFECKARIDSIGLGWWPAFWLQSQNFGKTLNTAVDGAEIDIMEFPKGNPYSVEHAIHYNGYKEHYRYFNSYSQSNSFVNNQYNIYGLEWTPTVYRFFINGYLVWEINKEISQTNQYIILSTEVGNRESFKNNFPKKGTEYRIDYVRVYKKNE